MSKINQKNHSHHNSRSGTPTSTKTDCDPLLHPSPPTAITQDSVAWQTQGLINEQKAQVATSLRLGYATMQLVLIVSSKMDFDHLASVAIESWLRKMDFYSCFFIFQIINHYVAFVVLFSKSKLRHFKS